MTRLTAVSALLILSVFLCANAFAINLVTNGRFETGDFTGWTVLTQSGSYGNWYVSGPGNTPASGHPSVGPASGNFYAVTDQTGQGCQVLYQMVTVPSPETITVSFDMFANNWDGGTYINGLDYTIYPNEHCRVDVLQPNANPFSTSPADIIQNFFLGGAPVGAPQAYTHYSFTASDVSPGTYMLRFAEVDNSGYFSQGVDNVRVYTPEPSSALFLLTALPFAGLLRRRK